MDYRSLVFGLLFLVSALIAYSRLRAEPRYQKGSDSHQIAIDALFLAIIFVMGLVPQFGYLTIFPGFSLTLIHIPVLIGAYLYGAKKGALYGFYFGVTSLLSAVLNNAGFNAFFVYPWVSVLPRLVWGFLAGLVFQLMKKATKIYSNGLVVGGTSFLLTCLHSVLVFLDLYVFFPQEMQAFLFASTTLGVAFKATVLVVVALGMSGEALLASLVVPAVGRSVIHLRQRSA